MPTISTLYIQILTYIATAAGAILSGFLSSHFADIPPTVVIGIAGGVGYFIHHYLDGLLKNTTAALSASQAVSSQAGLLLPEPQVIGTAVGTPQGVTITAANVHVGGPVARSATEPAPATTPALA